MLTFQAQSPEGVFVRVLVPNEAHTELLANEVSFSELVFDDDDPQLDVLTPGCRVRVVRDADDVMVLQGPVVGRSGSGPAGVVTVTVEDDFRRFRNLGWQVPGAAITAQGTAEYKRYTGPTETVVKAACQDLSDRIGYGWTIPVSVGLGSVQRVEFRMHPLVDKLLPLVQADGLLWSLRDGVVDVTQGSLFSTVLTSESGVLGSWSWSESLPTATRVVVGGSGEGTARTFRTYTDAVLEGLVGEVVEVFKDSRMADGVTDLSPDAAEVFAENAGAVSVSAVLNESPLFRWGVSYELGDRVPVQIGSVSATEMIRSVVVDQSPSEGDVVTPTIGALEDSADSRLAGDVSRLARALRAQGKE